VRYITVTVASDIYGVSYVENLIGDTIIIYGSGGR
jgi:hypothetical protein